ncbi:MAG: hypothetical protein PHP57_06970 [Sideroxydans sp.]|nr:hypothetical protein [Sideroxydans sp.]
MPLNDRDYLDELQSYRKASSRIQSSNSAIEDEYWRLLAEKQQAQLRIITFLSVAMIALAIYFRGEIFHFIKQLSSANQPEETVVQTSPAQSVDRISSEELPFPSSGSIIRYQESSEDTAKFTVTSDQGKDANCVVKLETWQGGNPVLEIFVKAGDTAETQLVPLGEYRVKFACGKHWYGKIERFGRGTPISTGLTPLVFSQVGKTINGNVLTLTKTFNGNFRTNDSYFNKF